MKFNVEKKQRPRQPKVFSQDLNIARSFAKRIYNEFGAFISALVLFGSATGVERKGADIDILIILDDVHVKLAPEIMETYKVITEKAIIEISPRIHIQTMKLTSFWEYMRAGDPVAINMLRSGVALIDTGFFDPLQALLDEGRIRPTKESVYTYFTMSYASLERANQHLLTGLVDLYWAAVDASHSALMSLGETPPSPEHVADLINEKLVKKRIMKRKYANIMRELYEMSKKVIHRDIKTISGREYENYKLKTEDLVKRMKKFIETRK